MKSRKPSLLSKIKLYTGYIIAVLLFLCLIGSNVYLFVKINKQEKQLQGYEEQRQVLYKKVENLDSFTGQNWEELIRTISVLSATVETVSDNVEVANYNSDLFMGKTDDLYGRTNDLYGKVSNLQKQVNTIVDYLTR